MNYPSSSTVVPSKRYNSSHSIDSILPPSPPISDDEFIEEQQQAKKRKLDSTSTSGTNNGSTNPITSIQNYLNHFIKAGTITLPNFTLTNRECENGEWEALNPDLLIPIRKEVEDVKMEPAFFLPTPPSSPNKGKQKAFSQEYPDLEPPPLPSSPSSLSVTAESDVSLLETILLLQNCFTLTVQMKASASGGVNLRIYLIPLDYKFVDVDLEKTRKRRRTASSAEILSVLERIELNEEVWKGNESGEGAELIKSDTRSLLEVYQAIESPSYDATFVDQLKDITPEIRLRLQDALLENPLGFKTDLYIYQRAALAKMLSRELVPQKLADPSYQHFVPVDSDVPYYLSRTGEVKLSPPKFLEPKGGILAEEMGVGKTAICLALVLSTIGELPNLDNAVTILEGKVTPISPVVSTSLSSSFPFKKYLEEAEKLRFRVRPLLEGSAASMTQKELDEYQEKLEEQDRQDLLVVTPPLPSLVNLVINYIKTSAPQVLQNKDLSSLLPENLVESLEETIPYYYLHYTEAFKDSRPGRKIDTSSPPKIILLATTLIVLPTLLIQQWKGEIIKHCEENSLRVLVLTNSKNKFPKRPEDYRNYDLVLMSVARFKVASEEKVGGLGVGAKKNVKISEPDRSWLTQVHFKRLIVDEGHALGNSGSTSNMRTLASELRVESRWAVSGTPSRNLVSKSTVTTLNKLEPDHLFDEGGDKSDFDRLGNLLSKYLHHSAYPTPRDWSKLFSTDRLENRPQLQLALNAIIVRSQPDKVNEIINLPKLEIKVVRLEMEEAERLNYNCLLAMFVANAVTSQRTDQDYFFQPNNKDRKEDLNRLSGNLNSSSTFFGSLALRELCHDTLEFVKSFFTLTIDDDEHRARIEKAQTWSQSDREALALVVSKLEEAFANQEWKWIVTLVHPGIEIKNMSLDLTKSFGGLNDGRLGSSSSIHSSSPRNLWSLGSINRLKVTTKYLLQDDNSSFESGEEFDEEVITFNEKKKREEASRYTVQEEVTEGKKKQRKKTINHKALPLDSTLSDVRLGRTTSSKINYILSKIIAEPNEKFLVFCNSNPDSLFAYLSEALDVFKISHVIFAGNAKKDSSAKVTTFNTSNEHQVALLSVSHAARGLHLVGATRVIFLEPIWHRDLERQALKRAHRVGQSKVVKAEILIIKDSFEDTFYKRREELSGAELSAMKVPHADKKLKDVLQSSFYLPASQSLEKGNKLGISLF